MTRFLEDLRTPLLHLLMWSAVAEFLLLRIFLRLGPVLPVQEPLLPLYRGIQTLGLAALNLAFLAACVLLIVTGAGMAARPKARFAAVLLWLAVAVNAGFGLLTGLVPGAAATAVHALVTLAALIALAMIAPPGQGGARGGQPTPGRLAIGLVVAADGLALLQALSQGAPALGLPLPGTTLPLLFAEALAIAAAIVLPWSFGVRPSRRPAILGIVLGLALIAALLTRPWILSTVAMWTISFSLGLPGALYAVALGIAVAALPSLWRAGGTQGIAARGLLLVGLAGLKLDYSYFSLLALAGVTLVCLPHADRKPTGILSRVTQAGRTQVAAVTAAES